MTLSKDTTNEKESRCSSCGTIMQFAYTVDFRTGVGGKSKLLFGDSIRSEISLLPLNVYVCPNCGKVDAGEAIKKSLLNLAKKHKETNPSSF